jgi:hypothetical protein
MPNNPEATARIRCLNDVLRATFTGGKVVMTDGVAALPETDLARLLADVRSFDEFNGDNDPHGEHDFGSVQLAGRTYFFKVDYYALDMEGGSYRVRSWLNRGVYGNSVPMLGAGDVIPCDHLIRGAGWSNAPSVRFESW